MVQSRHKPPKKKIVRLRDLKRGMIVRSRASGESYLIDANYGDRVTAITSVDITNIDEWEVL